MRILFVYSVQKAVLQEKPLLTQEGIYFGISFLAAYLKKSGHACELVVLDRKYKNKNFQLLQKYLREFSPGILAFTAVFSEFEFICQIALEVKKKFPKLFLYAGGVHITLNAHEDFLDIFDAICIGEGEYATLQLVEKLEKGESIEKIPNLWIKASGKIRKNGPDPFIENLDNLPFPERNMWKKWILEPNSGITILLGRGCPFNCSYCCNHKLKKVTSGKYVRLRSPENILEEIKELYIDYPQVRQMRLEIETLGMDLKWLNSLCEKLSEFGSQTHFQISFSTNLRIYPSLDIEAIFSNLKKANITEVTIGLESGNFRIRKEILNRIYSNELVLFAAQTAKKYGIKIALYNMVGLPTETPAEFEETLNMNRKIQPYFHATSIFFPYPGTKLYELCRQEQLIPEKIKTDSERQFAVLNLPDFSRKQIQRSFDSFHYQVYKEKENRSFFKLCIYYSMQYLGHNFYAGAKVCFLAGLYRLKGGKHFVDKYLKIFQKE